MFCLRVVRKKYVYIYIEYGIYVYKYPLSILKNRDTLVCFGILLVLFFFSLADDGSLQMEKLHVCGKVMLALCLLLAWDDQAQILPQCQKGAGGR